MINLGPQEVTGILQYIDPGTGSLIIQLLVAGSLSGLVFLKIYWKKLFSKKDKEAKDEDKNKR